MTIAPTGWLSIADVAREMGISVKAARDQMSPDHPDPIPCYVTRTSIGRRRWRIKSEEFAAWFAAHRVQP